MKAIRSPWLAAALLLPLGAAVTATEAQAQHNRSYDRGYHQVDRVTLERFVMRARDGLQAGDVVRYRMRGTPNSTAWVDIQGVGVSLPMDEVRPGVYVAEYRIRPRDNRRVFDDAVAHIQRGGARVTARLHDVDINHRGWDDDRYGRDDHPRWDDNRYGWNNYR